MFKDVRDCWQITFVRFNRFCQLSKPPPHPPVLNITYNKNG